MSIANRQEARSSALLGFGVPRTSAALACADDGTILSARSALRGWTQGLPVEARPDDFADLLAREGFGEAIALRELLPLVYSDLKRIAHRQLLRHVRGATMSTTVLVHETWARLASAPGAAPLERAHFVSLCARVMRQVIIDHARARSADKRGGGAEDVDVADAQVTVDAQGSVLLTLAEALEDLARSDVRLARLIEQHWFIGLEPEELAALNALSLRSVQRELKRARAWLRELLGP